MTKLRQLFFYTTLAVCAVPGVAGEPSTPSAATSAPAVKGGQAIDVVIADEDLRVVTRATALASGQVGEVIRVRLENTGRMMLVRITGPNMAQIEGLKPQD